MAKYLANNETAQVHQQTRSMTAPNGFIRGGPNIVKADIC